MNYSDTKLINIHRLKIIHFGEVYLEIGFGMGEGISCKAQILVGSQKGATFIVAKEADERMLPNLPEERFLGMRALDGEGDEAIRHQRHVLVPIIKRHFNLVFPIAYLEQDIKGQTVFFKSVEGQSPWTEADLTAAISDKKFPKGPLLKLNSYGYKPVDWS